MKLNYKRTFFVGFAFFLICLFWQAYDTLVPLMLTNKFGLDQTWSGIIMSLDNILALFMLPIFGALSDKKDSRFGKRTPFIFFGTICAIICFVGLTFVDNAQMSKVLAESNRETYWEQNYEIENSEYQSVTNRDVPVTYTVQDYASKLRFNAKYDQLNDEQKAEVKAWYVKGELAEGETAYDLLLDQNLSYVYSNGKDGEEYTLVLSAKDADGKTVYKYVTGDKAGTVASADEAKNMRPVKAYTAVVQTAQARLAKSVSGSNVHLIVLFIIILLMCLISMATFRSPAVALMPDVTLKPLRSKANAIINLMGAAGGIIVLGMGMIFGTGNIANQMMSYTWFIVAACGIMAIALAVFLFTVKEKKWNAEMLEQQAVLDEEEAKQKAEKAAEAAPSEQTDGAAEATPDAEAEGTGAEKPKNKLPKDKLVSLILILASVALWYVGYNAITSKYSVYALNVLHMDYNATLIIAQAAAIVSYIPVGIISSKLGRKKTILIGVAMLTVSFFGAIFINANSPSWLMWILFALAGIAWATINVNSFPMVVELATGSDIGKYTGYYYTASMAAQVITPILSGALMDAFGTMGILFPYATIFVALSFVTMIFVKHGDSRPETPQSKLEMLGGADD